MEMAMGIEEQHVCAHATQEQMSCSASSPTLSLIEDNTYPPQAGTVIYAVGLLLFFDG